MKTHIFTFKFWVVAGSVCLMSCNLFSGTDDISNSNDVPDASLDVAARDMSQDVKLDADVDPDMSDATDVREPLERITFADDIILVVNERREAIVVDQNGNPREIETRSVVDESVVRWDGNELVGVGEGVTQIGATVGEFAAATTVVVRQEFVEVAVGSAHSCGKTAGGRILCWGANDKAQLFDGSRLERWFPETVDPLPAILSRLTSGGKSVCGFVQNSLTCWGKRYGGDVVVEPITFGQSVSIAALSDEHLCYTTIADQLFCVGANDLGQSEPDNESTRFSTSRQPFVGESFRDLATGAFHTCGIHSSGDLWCWGSDSRGQLGGPLTDGHSIVTRDSPITDVTAGPSHTCIISAGNIECFGNRTNGEFDGTMDGIIDLPVDFVAFVSGYSSHTCAKDSDDSIWCFGSNGQGQLGQGTIVSVDSPILMPFSKIATGGEHTCGIDDAGLLFCFGSNVDGQLGTGFQSAELTPTLVSKTLIYRDVTVEPSGTYLRAADGATPATLVDLTEIAMPGDTIRLRSDGRFANTDVDIDVRTGSAGVFTPTGDLDEPNLLNRVDAIPTTLPPWVSGSIVSGPTDIENDFMFSKEDVVLPPGVQFLQTMIPRAETSTANDPNGDYRVRVIGLPKVP